MVSPDGLLIGRAGWCGWCARSTPHLGKLHRIRNAVHQLAGLAFYLFITNGVVHQLDALLCKPYIDLLLRLFFEASKLSYKRIMVNNDNSHVAPNLKDGILHLAKRLSGFADN